MVALLDASIPCLYRGIIKGNRQKDVLISIKNWLTMAISTNIKSAIEIKQKEIFFVDEFIKILKGVIQGIRPYAYAYIFAAWYNINLGNSASLSNYIKKKLLAFTKAQNIKMDISLFGVYITIIIELIIVDIVLYNK